MVRCRRSAASALGTVFPGVKACSKRVTAVDDDEDNDDDEEEEEDEDREEKEEVEKEE